MSEGRDREAIRSLVAEYASRLDAGELDGVAALFADATFRSARDGRVRHGADAVRAMYDPVVLYDDGTPRTRHVLGNVEIDLDGDAAASRCTFTVLLAPPDGALRAVLAGRYVDRFVRHRDGWRFAERVVHPDLVGDLAAHMAAVRE